MAFADIFRNLSQRLPTAMNDPMLQLGLQLMQAGGPQAQQMSTGQRLAQAAQGFQGHLAQQQQLDSAAVLNQLRQLQMQQAQNEAKSADDLRQRMQDPAFAASLPEHSRRLAAAGASPEQVFRVYEMESRLTQAQREAEFLQQHRAAQLGIQQQRADAYVGRQNQLAAGGGGQPGAPAGPKMPNPRQFNVRSLGQGWFQQEVFDPATGQYRDHGAPYRQGVQADIGEDYGEPPVQDAGEQPAPWSSLPTGSPRVQGGVGQQAPAPQMVPTDVEFNANGVPVPTGHRPVQPPTPPIAAAGGGQARAQDDKAAAFAADLAQAQRLLQARPELRDEINRRLMQTYGRGL